MMHGHTYINNFHNLSPYLLSRILILQWIVCGTDVSNTNMAALRIRGRDISANLWRFLSRT